MTVINSDIRWIQKTQHTSWPIIEAQLSIYQQPFYLRQLSSPPRGNCSICFSILALTLTLSGSGGSKIFLMTRLCTPRLRSSFTLSTLRAPYVFHFHCGYGKRCQHIRRLSSPNHHLNPTAWSFARYTTGRMMLKISRTIVGGAIIRSE